MNENASTQAQGAGPATPEQIQELPRRYAIGKRPLSRLLGWGELTYTRLLDGGVPNAAHSEEIRRMLDDPAAFARLLEIGREHKVITGAAYDKSRRAVDALLAEAGHSEAGDALKIFAVADRICALTGGNVTPQTLQMLMHVAQERAAAAGEALFSQEPNEVEWGFEYPQIAAGYSFEAIQSAAARMGGAAGSASSASAASGEPEAEPEGEPAPAPEPEPEAAAEPELATEVEAGFEAAPEREFSSPGKKGKKGKKDKKGKGKKKDKKAKKAAKKALVDEPKPAAAPELDSASTPAPIAQPASAVKPADKPAVTMRRAVSNGPLSPAECQLVDNVVARYLENLSASFSLN